MPVNPPSRPFVIVSALALCLGPGVALAHPGHAGTHSNASFISGLLHPLTGIDHLVALLAVGIWLALTISSVAHKAGVITMFLAAMATGCLISLAGLKAPAIEPLIMFSLLAFGLLAATAAKLPVWAVGSLTGFFALFHGLAHGQEMPAQANPGLYIAGFLLCSLILMLAGTALGGFLHQHARWLARLSGAVVASYGLALLGLA